MTMLRKSFTFMAVAAVFSLGTTTILAQTSSGSSGASGSASMSGSSSAGAQNTPTFAAPVDPDTGSMDNRSTSNTNDSNTAAEQDGNINQPIYAAPVDPDSSSQINEQDGMNSSDMNNDMDQSDIQRDGEPFYDYNSDNNINPNRRGNPDVGDLDNRSMVYNPDNKDDNYDADAGTSIGTELDSDASGNTSIGTDVETNLDGTSDIGVDN